MLSNILTSTFCMSEQLLHVLQHFRVWKIICLIPYFIFPFNQLHDFSDLNQSIIIPLLMRKYNNGDISG